MIRADRPRPRSGILKQPPNVCVHRLWRRTQPVSPVWSQSRRRDQASVFCKTKGLIIIITQGPCRHLDAVVKLFLVPLLVLVSGPITAPRCCVGLDGRGYYISGRRRRRQALAVDARRVRKDAMGPVNPLALHRGGTMISPSMFVIQQENVTHMSGRRPEKSGQEQQLLVVFFSRCVGWWPMAAHILVGCVCTQKRLVAVVRFTSSVGLISGFCVSLQSCSRFPERNGTQKCGFPKMLLRVTCPTHRYGVCMNRELWVPPPGLHLFTQTPDTGIGSGVLMDSRGEGLCIHQLKGTGFDPQCPQTNCSQEF